MATEVKDVVAAALSLSVEQRAQLGLLEAAWIPLADLKAIVDQRDALMAERANLIETKREQIARLTRDNEMNSMRATSAEGRVALLEEDAAQRDIEIAFLLGDSAEMAEEAGAVRTEEEAFVWSQIRTNLNARLAASARARLAKGGQ